MQEIGSVLSGAISFLSILSSICLPKTLFKLTRYARNAII